MKWGYTDSKILLCVLMWYPKWCLWSLSIITCLHHVFLNYVKTLQLHIRPSSNSLSKKATHLATTCHKIWYLFLTSATKKFTDHLFDLLIVENTFSRDTHTCVCMCAACYLALTEPWPVVTTPPGHFRPNEKVSDSQQNIRDHYRSAAQLYVEPRQHSLVWSEHLP